eukprot:14132-Heterococcus_DN1.PRE.5
MIADRRVCHSAEFALLTHHCSATLQLLRDWRIVHKHAFRAHTACSNIANASGAAMYLCEAIISKLHAEVYNNTRHRQSACMLMLNLAHTDSCNSQRVQQRTCIFAMSKPLRDCCSRVPRVTHMHETADSREQCCKPSPGHATLQRNRN